uniref:Zinc carboxypeptidase A 1 n=1 Tax=Xenopsylla cheopis TaxID=163159 RepID=A0A6M2E0R1_XENCH
MKLLIILATVAIGLCLGEKILFNNYKVYRVTAGNYEQIEILKQLEKSSDAYNFWTEIGLPGKDVDIMVPPHKLEDFEQMLNYNQFSFRIMVDDVQKDIDRQVIGSFKAAYGWTQYYDLDVTYQWLESLAAEHPGVVSVITIGKSFEGQDIKGVKLTFGANKPGVFLDAGIHAREWITTATATYVLNELLNSKDAAVRKLAESHEWYIFPNINPDGYRYSQKTNRLWRKTRQPFGTCYGTDANRNFAYKWMTGGASSNPCSDTFAGPTPFSEPETRAVSNFIMANSQNLAAYLSFHSYSQVLLWPYGHTSQHLDNHDDLNTIGKQTVAALAKRFGTKYDYGNIVETMYVATGGSMDWVKGTYKTPITYTYELRDTGRYGFLLPPDQIIPCGQEILDSLVAMFQAASDLGYFKN